MGLGTAHTLQTNLDALDVTGDGPTEVDVGRTEDVWTANVTPTNGATELEVTGGFQTEDVWDFGETAEDSTRADGATGDEDEAVATVFSTVDHAALAKAQAASPE